MLVLLAEDDSTSRILLQSILVRWGYDVLVAEDGEVAWQILASSDAPDIAVLDWMMPRLDGPSVCKRVRALDRKPAPYLLLLTARSHGEDITEGLEAGADDYLIKPFDFGELAARLRIACRTIDLQRQLLDSRKDREGQ
jgi:DNA-binding response OmpR family regulator